MNGDLFPSAERSVRYRVWDRVNRVMHEPEANGDFVLTSTGNVIEVSESEAGGYNWVSRDDHVPLLSTNMRDIDGVEVFEGDILEFEDHRDLPAIKLCQRVRWEDGGLAVSNLTWHDVTELVVVGALKNVRIVGNVFTKPVPHEGQHV